jgi:hypothetical protein
MKHMRYPPQLQIQAIEYVQRGDCTKDEHINPAIQTTIEQKLQLQSLVSLFVTFLTKDRFRRKNNDKDINC